KGPRGGTFPQQQAAYRREKVPRLRRPLGGSARDDEWRRQHMDDLIVRGATVIDGTGSPPRLLDVAVRDGRISAVEPGRSDSAARQIDGTGRILAPGFIDIHTHSDFTLPLNPLAEAKIRQGVTTEIVGNCGFSVAPALPGKAGLLADYLSASAPWL